MDYKARGRTSRNEEWLTFADDNHVGLFEITKTPMHDTNGQPIGVLGIGRDITAARHAQQALLQGEQRLQQAVRVARTGIFEHDHRNGHYYWSPECEICHRYVPEVEVTDLSNIILETIAGLNEINPLTGRLIQIARDGKISDDEMKDFAYISKKLDEISLAIDSLNLWVDKTAGEQGLNLELLNAEKEKLK